MAYRPKVAFVYRPSCRFLTGKHHDNNYYRFFIEHLPTVERVDYQLVPVEGVLVASDVAGADVVIVPWLADWAIPDVSVLYDMPCVRAIMAPDLHDMTSKWQASVERLGASLVFERGAPRLATPNIPDGVAYRQVWLGLHDVPEVPDWADRYFLPIVLSGAMGHPAYAMRRACDTHVATQHISGFYGNEFPILLKQYRAGIAACSSVAVQKYIELPNCGMLTFMEVTPENGFESLGFEDGETCVAMTDQNWHSRFDEYVATPNDPRWQKIADAGRKYTQGRYAMPVQADILFDAIEELL